MKLKTKVLVIGGGPAGSSAARFLAEGSSDVILLEKNLNFIKPCGGGIPSSAFEEFDIPFSLARKEISEIRVVSPSGERLDIELEDGKLLLVERGFFDQALRNTAKQKGARVIEGEFVGLAEGSTYMTEARSGDETISISSEYVVAADGVNSKVRTSLGIKPSGALFTVLESIKGVKTDTCEFWFGSSHAPRSYSWIFPAQDGISAGTGTFEQGTIRTMLERFKAKRGIQSEGKKRVYRIPLWEGSLYAKDRILFAGDSAGQVMPLSYEGIYYAMKSGEFAARAILEGKPENYRKMWKERFQRRFVLMEKLRDYFLRDDASAEKLIALHRKPEIRQASMKLWLKKTRSSINLRDYIRLFGKILN
jgi:geranylgeranyl reductase